MEFFLTGNARDFSPLYGRRINQMPILTPREFLLTPHLILQIHDKKRNLQKDAFAAPKQGPTT